MKQIAIAACVVIAFVAVTAVGWMAGQPLSDYRDNELSTDKSGPVATEHQPDSSSAPTPYQAAGNDPTDPACGQVDPERLCFRQALAPVPVQVESAANTSSGSSQVAELRMAWRFRSGSPAEQAKALAVYHRLAEIGNVVAQVGLGDLYRDGIAVVADLDQALTWYRRAAEQGDASGQLRLGVMYLEGRGVEQDEAAARSLFEQAATQGNVWGKVRLANMYRDGRGGAFDYATALRLYQEAAAGGNVFAFQGLGVMYMKGFGVKRDDKTAVAWFRRGAEAGHPGSMYSLGLMYLNGRGVRTDEAEALRWLEAAAASGHLGAKEVSQRFAQRAATRKKAAAPSNDTTTGSVAGDL